MKLRRLIGLIAVIALVGAETAENQDHGDDHTPSNTADEDQLEALEGSEIADEQLEVITEDHGDEHHDDEHGTESKEYGQFQIPWAIPDFVVGLTMGAYGPVNSRTRNGDCFSKWYSWGLATIELSNFFTRPFQVDSWRTWVALIIQAGTLGSSTYFTWDRCINDLDEAKLLHWNHHYGFLADDVSIPRVEAGTSSVWGTENHDTDSTAFTVGMVFALVLGAISIAGYVLTGYYYWGFGMQLGYFVSNLIVAIDYWGNFELFHPMPAHERYLPTDH